MKSLNLIYYSPTGSTQKIVRNIGQKLNLNLGNEYSLSAKLTNFNPAITDSSLTIIGMPVYGGRIPLDAVEYLKKIKATNAPAVLVVVYGNRAFEDALVELNQLATEAGFKVIAGAAFIGEHSYSTPEKPVAEGRPDALDYVRCGEFANGIQAKLEQFNLNEAITLTLPGNYPYKERPNTRPKISPVTDNAICTLCGDCVDACPTNAITMNGQINTDVDLCTWCCACVKACPHDARTFTNELVEGIRERLFTMCSDRKEPEFFM